MSLIRGIYRLFVKITPAAFNKSLAEEAARELVAHQSCAEYHAAMAAFYEARLNRLNIKS